MRLPLPFVSHHEEKEVFVNGLLVKFIVNTKLKFVVPLFEVVLETIVKYDQRVRMFNYMVFVLEDERNYANDRNTQLRQLVQYSGTDMTLAYVKPNEVIRVEHLGVAFARIHFNVDMIVLLIVQKEMGWLFESKLQLPDTEYLPKPIESDIITVVKGRLLDEMYVNFNHELTHAINNLNRVMQERYEKVKVKLEWIKAKLLQTAKHIETAKDYGSILADLREIVELLLRKTYSEGLAKYYEKVFSEPNFFWERKKVFADLYLEAYQKSHYVLGTLKKVLELLRPEIFADKRFKDKFNKDIVLYLFDEVEKLSYHLGLHIVFTVEDTLSLGDKLVNIKIGELIMLYENACKERNIQPLISLSSGKGKLFDYKEALRLLHRAEKRA